MTAIYNLLDKFRLESYYKGFCDIGVKDERDFIDSVTVEDLEQIGKTIYSIHLINSIWLILASKSKLLGCKA